MSDWAEEAFSGSSAGWQARKGNSLFSDVDDFSLDNTSIGIPFQTPSSALFGDSESDGSSLASELDWDQTSAIPTKEVGSDPSNITDIESPEPSIYSSFSSVSLEKGDKPTLPSTDSYIIHQEPSEPSEPSELSETFQIEVTNPQIQGEGVSSFVTYTVITKTSLNLYKQKEMEVARRFSDFLWLQEQLFEHHKGIIVPPVPNKDLLKTNKISGNRFGKQFLEYRQRELERFLVRVTSHPILSTSKCVQVFLETTDSSTFTSLKEEKRGSGFFSRFTKAVSSTVQGVEIDAWFSAKAEYMVKLKAQLDVLCIAAQNVNQYHQSAIAVHTPFMQSMKEMGMIEKDSAKLSNSFTKVSEIIAQLEFFEHELSQNSGVAFVDVLTDYARLTESVQKVLDWRLTKLGELQAAEKEVQRAPSSTQAQDKVREYKEIFESASELVRSELLRFESTKEEEIQFAILEFVQFNMNREICMKDLWRKFMQQME